MANHRRDRARPRHAGPVILPANTFGRDVDVLADVHGCLAELELLLARLGWERFDETWRHPDGRLLAVAGDVVDRGPAIVETVELLMRMVEAGDAVVTVGNHDDKLFRALSGRPVTVSHGLDASLRQLDAVPTSVRARARAFLGSLPSHAVLDDGRLVVAHAGLPEHLHGSSSDTTRDVAMYGLTRPGKDEWGLPIRVDWAADYHGEAYVVYGHTPVRAPLWRNRTIDIDTGCVFGGSLTAVRYPELEVVSVPALGVYQEKGSPWRTLGPGGPPVGADEDERSDVAG